MIKNPIFVSKEGGTINRYKGDSGWLFRVSYKHLFLYSNDIISAKLQLKRLERLSYQSGNITLRSMKKQGKSLRELVERAAAPYLERYPN